MSSTYMCTQPLAGNVEFLIRPLASRPLRLQACWHLQELRQGLCSSVAPARSMSPRGHMSVQKAPGTCPGAPRRRAADVVSWQLAVGREIGPMKQRSAAGPCDVAYSVHISLPFPQYVPGYATLDVWTRMRPLVIPRHRQRALVRYAGSCPRPPPY